MREIDFMEPEETVGACIRCGNVAVAQVLQETESRLCEGYCLKCWDKVVGATLVKAEQRFCPDCGVEVHARTRCAPCQVVFKLERRKVHAHTAYMKRRYGGAG